MMRPAEVNVKLNVIDRNLQEIIEDLFQIVDTTIEDVPVRIYSPLKKEKNKPLPAVVYYHGGAFYMGSVGK